MALPKRAAYDGYGRPLPTLADTSTADLYANTHNEKMRYAVAQQLEAKFHDMLQAGVHGELVLRLVIVNGRITQDIDMTETRRYRQNIQGASEHE